ncbi:hypothetical protein LEL_03594 [Akanthomyces lecanii RCEF 1005]|uniref:25S rRNA (uridine-N(3))-methyltransferase BMT5-like domain-containing protein n=1 Tax=Akanthomyces lecanii RCEF 1005 TaxID=1081108 RepID=A0A162KUV5_CORDF|nr:hypothetical protein LEL_03594 [Akanthomyces lecanii RCEF 1005]
MGGKRRKLQLKRERASGKGGGPKIPTPRGFIPNRHSDKPLAAAGPGSGGVGFQQPQSRKTSKKTQEQRERQLQRNQENPTIPFDAADDRILLVGEGDLSFAASLVYHHRCRHVTATVLDRDHAELVAKYPSADANIAIFHAEKKPDSKKVADAEVKDGDDDDDDDDDEAPKATAASDDPESDSDADYDSYGNRHPRPPPTNRLLYNTDATKLPPSLGKPHPFDRILFNFPHVGGKSTDVNRQVRYNQELLVAFFQRAVPLLAPGGSIVVTLFDGEPYTLWNVKDLARHVGLQADASFRFLARAYPGYRHARTIGVIRSKKGAGAEGGAWRGEDRPARSYVFVKKGDVLRKPKNQQQPVKKRKRSGSDDEADSSEDDLDD